LRDQGVKYLFGAYVDLYGVPKSKAVPIDHLQDMAAGSERYTVGGLEGMGELGPHEDECQGIPDLDSLVILPWDRRYALAPAYLRFAGAPYSHDSRYVLKTQLDKAAELGYRVNLGIEPEFYVLEEVDGKYDLWAKTDTLNAPTRAYDIEATILADRFLEPMIEYMNELGWDVYSFDHEGGDSQFEFDFSYCDAMEMADRMLIFRLMAKHVARTLGCVASFMPKPFSDGFGSGAHMNMSLVDAQTGANAFADESNGTPGSRNGHTALEYHFTAGLLRHAGALTALACSTVNSYKRLLPIGLMDEISWAPVYCGYGDNNRTLMCRLPSNRHCVELRIADSGCNFYLVAAAMLAAGLEGIRQKFEPGDPVNADTYTLSDAELAAAGVDRLPQNLSDACDALERDELIREVLGSEFHASFLGAKRAEWRMYSTVVGEWERDQYLHLW
jgi:glutamine synthetase